MLKPVSDYFSTLQKQIAESLWPQRRVLMVGPSAGGKTTILYQLKLGETVTTIPTTGFNVESLTPILGVTFTIWEVGAYWNNRGGLWRHYVQGTDAVICVVDSSDMEQIEEARSTLWRMYEEYDEQLRGSALLVFANKQDYLHAMAVAEIRDRLELETRAGRRRWHIEGGSSAVSGDGLVEGMAWMTTQLKGRTWRQALGM
ncbi:ARF/SAR protein [Linnemannia elongata AG-77]|uniref:ARF/SAR protein n=1 Tax=Linnemannia elongata AG-77 TaxID=1314771 RepID=A0A197JVM5_9FUNG|nr:ARF/SAR protein [Linnemannia elongata AG-77]